MILQSQSRSALAVLRELGITEPDEIHIEAIAQHCRATIVYEPIEGSAARILGIGDSAIITVDSKSLLGRRRFSAGHELGHWMMDRGKVASFVCSEKTFAAEWLEDNPEKRANRYASDLLLPKFMFEPRAKGKEITFESVRTLARDFRMSLTATAIRLIELGSFPGVLICTGPERRRWFFRGTDVPNALRLKDVPGAYTYAYDLLRGGRKEEGPVNVQADGWIDRYDARRYTVTEDSIKISDDLVLTLLWWRDESQLLDLSAGEDEEDE